MGKRAAGGENLVQIWPKTQRTPPLLGPNRLEGGGFFARITPDRETESILDAFFLYEASHFPSLRESNINGHALSDAIEDDGLADFGIKIIIIITKNE